MINSDYLKNLNNSVRGGFTYTDLTDSRGAGS